jgi:hypothetical protein
MNPEIRKKLIVPFVVFLLILAINTNSIISGVENHNTSRVVIAVISTLIVLVCLLIMIRNINKTDGKKPPEA